MIINEKTKSAKHDKWAITFAAPQACCVGDDKASVIIEIVHIVRAQMSPAKEARQVGFGAP
jgi:hypothetical protein